MRAGLPQTISVVRDSRRTDNFRACGSSVCVGFLRHGAIQEVGKHDPGTRARIDRAELYPK